jgi:hypothetical protein
MYQKLETGRKIMLTVPAFRILWGSEDKGLRGIIGDIQLSRWRKAL